MNFLTPALSSLVALFIYVAPISAAEPSNTQIPDMNKSLSYLVSKHQENLGLVGLGAMIMQDGEILASAVAGERKHRSGVLLTDKDKWHIGSITKSFTATMIARLVERGELTWDTTIGEVYPDAKGISEGWHQVTIEQLLTHTSGASNDFSPTFAYLFRRPAEGPARMAAREGLILKFLKDEPEAPAGSRFFYSNTGVLIAGTMAEKITGIPWEQLIRNEIFIPLDIHSAGFGSPQDQESPLEQPRGHKSFLGFIVSVDNDANLPILAPAGGIHISLADLLVYANDHLQGESGQGKLLKRETYLRLHTPILESYAYGWIVNPHTDWADGTVIWHNGSNGTWYAHLAILPNSNTIIAITSNDIRGYGYGELTEPILEGVANLLEAGELSKDEQASMQVMQ